MEHYKYFVNKECEFFPCHKVNDIENFNCLFCYCPLYFLGNKCGGNFTYINDIKDCSHCTYPHNINNYDEIMKKLR